MDEITILINVASKLATETQNSILQQFQAAQKQEYLQKKDDSDDDLDLFVYNQLSAKKRKSNHEIKEKPASTPNNENYTFVTFLKDSTDLGFETQFKLTKSTFTVRK